MSKFIVRKLAFLSLFFAVLSTAISARSVTSLKLSEAITADGMVLDNSGNLYVTSAWQGSSIFKIALSTGQVSLFARNLKGPVDIVMDSDDNLLVSNWQGQEISIVDNKGNSKDWLHVGPKPEHLAFDSKGNLWLTIGSENSIFKISPDKTKTLVYQNGIIEYPLGLAISEHDEIYVGDSQTGQIYKFSEGQPPILFASIPGEKTWRLAHLEYVSGRLFAAGLNSHKIYEISSTGNTVLLAGSVIPGHENGDASTATFTYPVSLIVSKDKNSLYVFSGREKTDMLRIIDIRE